MNMLRESHEIIDTLQGAELVAAHALLRTIKTIHETSAQRINDCLETMRSMDEIDQLVYVTAVKAFLDDELLQVDDYPMAWTDKPFRFENLPKKHAEGVYISDYSLVKDALRRTGEFVTARDFAEMASSFELMSHNGPLVSEFLYQWVAAQQPDSFALQYCTDHALPSGKLSLNRDHYDRDFFYPTDIVFHRSVIDDYVERECFEGDKHRTIINPIISLLATDDWDFAVSQLSKVQRRKLS